MKLKKIIINGKVYYKEDENGNIHVTEKDNDSVEAEVIMDNDLVEQILKYTKKIEEKLKKYQQVNKQNAEEYKEKLSLTIEKYKSEFKKVLDEEELENLYDDCLNDLDDIFDEYDDLGKEDKKSTIFDSDFGSRISESINKAINKVFYSQNKKNNERNRNLSSLLPFMDKDDIHELVLMMLKEEEEYNDFDVSIMMPFVSSEDADLLFDHAISKKSKINLSAVVPFISQEKLDIVVDKYINGELEDLQVETLYPFLNKKSIKKLFEYYRIKK